LFEDVGLHTGNSMPHLWKSSVPALPPVMLA
jgi:hypothetical protein